MTSGPLRQQDCPEQGWKLQLCSHPIATTFPHPPFLFCRLLRLGHIAALQREQGEHGPRRLWPEQKCSQSQVTPHALRLEVEPVAEEQKES